MWGQECHTSWEHYSTCSQWQTDSMGRQQDSPFLYLHVQFFSGGFSQEVAKPLEDPPSASLSPRSVLSGLAS